MSVTIRELEYFVAVADHKHFGRAAESCQITQPTLSTQVRKLENQLGVSLLDRSSRTVQLTAVGEVIALQARKILQEQRNLLQLALDNQSPLGGEFRLGVIPTVAPYLLPKVLPSVRAELPKLHLHLSEVQTEVLVAKLQSREIDAGVLALAHRRPWFDRCGSLHGEVSVRSEQEPREGKENPRNA